MNFIRWKLVGSPKIKLNTFQPYVSQQNLLTHITFWRESMRRWSRWVRQTHVYVWTVRSFINQRYEEERTIECQVFLSDGIRARINRSENVFESNAVVCPMSHINNGMRSKTFCVVIFPFFSIGHQTSRQFPYLILTIDLVIMNIQLHSPLRTKSKQRNFDRAIQWRCDF